MSNEPIHPALSDAQKLIERFSDDERRKVVGKDGFVDTRTIGQAYSIAVMGHVGELETVLAETLYALGYQKGINTALQAVAVSRSDGMFKALATAILNKLKIGEKHE